MRSRKFLLVGLLAASLVGSVQATFLRGKKKAKPDCCASPCASSCDNGCGHGAWGAGSCDGCGQITVNATEWVQEQRQECFTVHKMEQRQITCTGHRCETYTEPCSRTVCCKRAVTETVNECRTVCERVPYWTEKTVMKEHWVTQQVTEMKSKTVDAGHYECKEVKPSSGGLFSRLCPGKKKKPDPCACECECVKTKQVWVPCKQTVCCPVTVCKKVKVCEPCTVKVCCYQTVTKQITVPVCKTSWVTEQKVITENVCKTRTVPYTYTKTVCECVPHQETRTVTVCVPKCVQKTINTGACCGAVSSCCH